MSALPQMFPHVLDDLLVRIAVVDVHGKLIRRAGSHWIEARMTNQMLRHFGLG